MFSELQMHAKDSSIGCRVAVLFALDGVTRAGLQLLQLAVRRQLTLLLVKLDSM
jgi:hypothetical protein